MKRTKARINSYFMALLIFVSAVFGVIPPAAVQAAELYDIYTYTGFPYAVVDDNVPEFTEEEKQMAYPYESYVTLDGLGRCGRAFASVCVETMPTEERGDISSVLPSGWQYNMGWQRCHLLGFQLTGENANELNLITGTEYMNVSGMLPFENMVADYVKETENHVLYRVTPVFSGTELVARGVHMEAWSIEDEGDGVCFDVYCFNVQPGKVIDYSTGIVTNAEKQASTITLKNKSATYTGKAISIGKAVVTGSTGKVTYIYYTDSTRKTKTTKENSGASAAGKAPVKAGTYYVIAKVAADDNYLAAKSNTAKLVIKKAPQTFTVAKPTAKLVYSDLKKASKTYSLGVTSNTGAKVTVSKLSGSSYITVGSTGKVTVKKGIPTGSYKVNIRLKAAAKGSYKATNEDVTIKVIVKKNQSVTASVLSKTYKVSDLKAGAKTFSIKPSAAGAITVKRVSGSGYLSVSKAGKVTVQEGTPAGTYEMVVKISAAATSSYYAKSVKKTVTVTVKKASSSGTYVLNTNTKVFHYHTCSSVSRMSEKNKEYSNESREEIIKRGYKPCSICKP